MKLFSCSMWVMKVEQMYQLHTLHRKKILFQILMLIIHRRLPSSFLSTTCFGVCICLIMLVLVSINCHRPANSVLDAGDEVRPPLPVVRETLYDDAAFYGYVFFLNFR